LVPFPFILEKTKIDRKKRYTVANEMGFIRLFSSLARSPYAGIIIVARGLCSLLPRKVLPLALELCLGGL
jgi:hypothetical protein